MELLKQARKPTRSSITRTINEMETELVKEEPDRHKLGVQMKKLDNLQVKMSDWDSKILCEMQQQGCTDDQYSQECAEIEAYDDRILDVKLKVEEFLNPPFQLCPQRREDSPTNSAAWYDSVAGSTSKRKNFKLPKIVLKKFSGEMMDWLGWWSQFGKIHEDDDIHTTDKFQYLHQAMTKGTRAMDLVESYPMTAENYPKVIEALTQRFGKPKILKQVYVRELLKLVIRNSKSTEKIQLSVLYDKLESHLRALESLGVTHEQTAEFLFPMIESSLPEDIFVAWQRSSLSRQDGSKRVPVKTESDFLMEFLREEVESESQRDIVRAGFETIKIKKEKTAAIEKKEELPTRVIRRANQKLCVLLQIQPSKSRMPKS